MAAGNRKSAVYSNGLKALQKRMGALFNNAKFSDTTFTVKNQKFHVLSQLVAVSSSTLDDVISVHYAHCDDKDINLHNVKCEESFSIILRYMYGLDINFGEMKLAVLCEVLNLAKMYQLDEFAYDLKQYLSKIETFQINSLAVLLNTSRKFNLNELYGKLTKFAFVIAKDFIKHKTVVNLRYEVLLDLIKADWFCAQEIDILTAVLNWHNDMKVSEASIAMVSGSTTAQHIDGDKFLDISTDYSLDIHTHVDPNIEDGSRGEKKHHNQHLQTIEREETKRQSKDNINKDGKDNKDQSADKHKRNGDLVTSEKFSALVESFSNNVLKSLLLNIRAKQITMLDYVSLCETGLFQTYELMLRNGKLFSQTNVIRKKFVPISNSNRVDEGSNSDASVTTATSCSNLKKYSREQLMELRNLPESLQPPVDFDWQNVVGSWIVVDGQGKSSMQKTHLSKQKKTDKATKGNLAKNMPRNVSPPKPESNKTAAAKPGVQVVDLGMPFPTNIRNPNTYQYPVAGASGINYNGLYVGPTKCPNHNFTEYISRIRHGTLE